MIITTRVPGEGARGLALVVGNVIMEVRGWSDSRKRPQTKELRQPPERADLIQDSGTDPEASTRNTGLLTPWFQASEFQNYKRVNVSFRATKLAVICFSSNWKLVYYSLTGVL